MLEAILSLLTAWGFQQEPYQAEERLNFEVIILCEADFYHLKDRQKLFLIIPREVGIRFAQSYDTFVLLVELEHLLDEFGVREEQISLLLQKILEVTALVKLIGCILRHI